MSQLCVLPVVPYWHRHLAFTGKQQLHHSCAHGFFIMQDEKIVAPFGRQPDLYKQAY